MKLCTLSFIKFDKYLLQEAYANPSYSIGVWCDYEGRRWEMWEQDEKGWYWRVKNGKVLDQYNSPVQFFYNGKNSGIYDQQMFPPTKEDLIRIAKSKETESPLQKARRTSGKTSRTLNVPKEIHDPESAYNYCAKLINHKDGQPGAPNEAAEAFLKDSLEWGYKYALLIQDRFWAIENRLISEGTPQQLVDYAEQAIWGPWETKAAIDKILTDTTAASNYAHNLGSRWPTLEKLLISRGDMNAIQYYLHGEEGWQFGQFKGLTYNPATKQFVKG